MNSSSANLVATTADVYIGDKSDNWSVTTNQTDPTNLVLTHTSNNKYFYISWTAGLNNGGAGGCKLQFMDQNVSGTWKDITGTNLNCDVNLSSQQIALPETFTTSWTGTHQVRIFISNSGLPGGTFATTLSCTSTGGSYNSSTPSVDENCNGQFNDSVLADSYTESCSNQGSNCQEYARHNADNCGGSVEWTSGHWCSISSYCSSWGAGYSYNYYFVGESWGNGCIWTENIYYYY